MAGEYDVRLESLNCFVAESAGREHNRKVTDKDSREPRVLLHLWHVLIGQQWHLVNDAIDVVNVEIMFESPLASVLEVVVESFDFRWLHHFRTFATDIIIARQINHLDILDQRKSVHKPREVSLVSEVIGKRRFI